MKIMYDRYNEVYAEGMDEGLRIGRAEGIDIGRKQAERETSVRMAAAYIRKYHESVSHHIGTEDAGLDVVQHASSESGI